MKKIGLLFFIVAVIIGVALANMFSWGSIPSVSLPEVSLFSKVKGSGNIAVEKRNTGDFSSIDVGGAFAVEIEAGKDFSLEVEADDNLLPLITTEVSNGTLRIDSNKRFSTGNRIKVRVSAPDIERLEVSGASKANLNNVQNEKLVVDVGGASGVTVKGTTGVLIIDMGGASQVNASGLVTKKTVVDGGGASSAKVNVAEELIVDLGGASRLSYQGNPAEIKKSTSGASRIKQDN